MAEFRLHFGCILNELWVKFEWNLALNLKCFESVKIRTNYQKIGLVYCVCMFWFCVSGVNKWLFSLLIMSPWSMKRGGPVKDGKWTHEPFICCLLVAHIHVWLANCDLKNGNSCKTRNFARCPTFRSYFAYKFQANKSKILSLICFIFSCFFSAKLKIGFVQVFNWKNDP